MKKLITAFVLGAALHLSAVTDVPFTASMNGDVLHEGGRPFDAGDGDDGLDRILADGVEHGEFAHLLEDAGPERHCLVALFSLVPVVDAVVFLVEFRPDAPRWTQRLTFALFRRSHTVHYGDQTF